MKIDLVGQTRKEVAKFSMLRDEKLIAEAATVLSISPEMKARKAVYRPKASAIARWLKSDGSKPFEVNTFTATDDKGQVIIAADPQKSIIQVPVTEEPIIFRQSAFLAHDTAVELALNWDGFTQIKTEEQARWHKLSGNGAVLLQGFGVIYPLQITGSQKVNTNHILAFQEKLTGSLHTLNNGKNRLRKWLGGENIYCQFEGQGTVWCCSHNAEHIVKKLAEDLRNES